MPSVLDLPVHGMTCASCAARVERRLNRLEGVEALVSYLHESATVTYDEDRVSPSELVAAVAAAGYTAVLPALAPGVAAAPPPRPADPPLPLLRRAVVCAVLTLPLLAATLVPALQVEHWPWVALQLATPVVLWGGWPAHRAAGRALAAGRATTDTLVSLGALASWLGSLLALLATPAGDPGYRLPTVLLPGQASPFLVATGPVLVTCLLLARAVQVRAGRRCALALRALRAPDPADAGRLVDGVERRVAAAALEPGDLVVVRAGEVAPVDGVVDGGRAALQHPRGDGRPPVEVAEGDDVAAGTRVVDGRLVLRALRTGSYTSAAVAARRAATARRGRAPVAELADHVAGVVVPVVLALAVAATGWWLGAGAGPTRALAVGVAVVVLGCPWAFVLAAPLHLALATSRAAGRGVLLRGPEVLEAVRRLDTVVLPAASVTTGSVRLVDVVAVDAVADDVLEVVAALAQGSADPVARAVLEAAAARRPLPAVEAVETRPRVGASGVLDWRAVVAGTPEQLAARGLDLPESLATAVAAARSAGRTVVLAGWDGAVRGAVLLAATVRPEAVEAVRALRGTGLRPVLVGADGEATTRAVAVEAGIEQVEAEVRPDAVADVVRRLQEQGRVVAAVGTGAQAAHALAQADVGLAVGLPADPLLEAADLTLVDGDLPAAVEALRQARRTGRALRGALVLALGLDVLALPLALTDRLGPLTALAVLALGSVLVAGSALRPSGRPRPDRSTPAAATAQRGADGSAPAEAGGSGAATAARAQPADGDGRGPSAADGEVEAGGAAVTDGADDTTAPAAPVTPAPRGPGQSGGSSTTA